jgi:Glycosyl transferase family 2
MSFKANPPLVSIIIPCYNCERWVAEAIESCIKQTYPNIEIIVVDDGSTDGSLEILRRFLPSIRLETGPNRGGNSARNTGFALSSGEYIQFLDADDYIEPDKIAGQVQFLEQTRANVVYGDFRYRKHLPDVRFSYLDESIQFGGTEQDLLASLLSMGTMNGGAILYRRHVINQVGGWDERLSASQDRDFLISVAISGAKIRYQPGCQFVYRKYGPVTVSSSNLGRWLANMCISQAKSKVALAAADQLTDEHKFALAAGYFEIARACYSIDPRTSFAIYAETLDHLIDKILDLWPHFQATKESRTFMALQGLFGIRSAMHLLFRVRGAINFVKSKLRSTFLLDIVLRIRGVRLERESDRRTLPGSLSTI